MDEWRTRNFPTFEKSSEEHGNFFKSIIEYNRFKNIVEIGVALATTTHYFCEAAKKTGGFVYGYDIFDIHGQEKQFPKFTSLSRSEEYLQSKGHTNFKLIEIDTLEPGFNKILKENTPEIDFAFIDGDHSYKGIQSDFENVYPLLSPFGIVLFHDTLRIDGCREFVIDLRTKFYDGTYDLVDFPWGFGPRRCGITLLIKRTYPIINLLIDEQCGSPSINEEIYKKEKIWYENELKR